MRPLNFLLGSVAVACLCAVTAGTVALAVELPDSEINPQTGDIESVGSTDIVGNLDVRHVVDPGQGGPKVVQILTSSSQDDLSPRIAIDGSGDAWIVWWRDGTTDEILYRVRDYPTGTWSTEAVISSSGEDSRNPAIVLDADNVWVVFELEQENDTGIAVMGGGKDDPVPFPGRSIVASTAFTGIIDISIHEESGNLWMTWIDDSDDVGWCEYDYGTESWGSTSYESYASDTVGDARGRIRDSVVPD